MLQFAPNADALTGALCGETENEKQPRGSRLVSYSHCYLAIYITHTLTGMAEHNASTKGLS